ncbi:hypothetical protein FisN_5Lu262 [Fistulifera solaris]|uniref:Uncharacterized protein n=1 Tax=Fistulifera solaris TaxID=1519565 RepID=A0A1Z5JIT4_FISSO|nr:hypothetical protein FisN_5Lu262 [Fistulifera solaris]|eukprot:GAX13846.1 hypothetical protein FisN_5Lu262 [Fistulifera solaris]
MEATPLVGLLANPSRTFHPALNERKTGKAKGIPFHLSGRKTRLRPRSVEAKKEVESVRQQKRCTTKRKKLQ